MWCSCCRSHLFAERSPISQVRAVTDAGPVRRVLGSASVSVLTIGPLGDRVGRRTILLSGAIAAMVMAFPLFWLYGTGNMAVILPTAVVMGIIEGGLLYSIQPAYFGELFPTKYRLAGMNLGYQAAVLAIGSTAPILGVLMLDWAGNDPWIFCLYLIAIELLALAGALVAGETLRRDLEGAVGDAALQQRDVSFGT